MKKPTKIKKKKIDRPLASFNEKRKVKATLKQNITGLDGNQGVTFSKTSVDILAISLGFAGGGIGALMYYVEYINLFYLILVGLFITLPIIVVMYATLKKTSFKKKDVNFTDYFTPKEISALDGVKGEISSPNPPKVSATKRVLDKVKEIHFIK